jgi:hypothetical protein
MRSIDVGDTIKPEKRRLKVLKTLIGGSLPVGVSLDLGTGITSGVVRSTFLSFFTVQVIDATGDTATQDLSISVNLPRCYSCHAPPNCVIRETLPGTKKSRLKRGGSWCFDPLR